MVSSHIAVVFVDGGPRNTRENETVLYQFFLGGFSDIPLTFFLSTSENGSFGIPGTYSMCD